MQVPIFLVTLGATVLGIFLSVQSGRAGNRPVHYCRVVSTVLLLVAAIVQAEILGRDWDFLPWRLNLHLFCAFSALSCLPGVVWSGLKLRNNAFVRPIHRRWVGSFIGLTVCAIATAAFMFLAATPSV